MTKFKYEDQAVLMIDATEFNKEELDQMVLDAVLFEYWEDDEPFYLEVTPAIKQQAIASFNAKDEDDELWWFLNPVYSKIITKDLREMGNAWAKDHKIATGDDWVEELPLGCPFAEGV